MADPVASFPPDVWGVVLDLCRGYEPLVRRVSRVWRRTVQKPRPGYTWAVDDWGCFLAARGERNLYRWYTEECVRAGRPQAANSALAAAATAGDVGMIEWLVSEWRASHFQDAEIAAAAADQLPALQVLRRYQGENPNDFPALQAAAAANATGALRWLLGENRYFGEEMRFREPAIQQAARFGRMEALEILLPGGKHPGINRCSACFGAAEKNRLVVLAWLAPLDSHETENAFLGAAFGGHCDLLVSLREQGATHWEGALQLACEAAQTAAVLLLYHWTRCSSSSPPVESLFDRYIWRLGRTPADFLLLLADWGMGLPAGERLERVVRQRMGHEEVVALLKFLRAHAHSCEDQLAGALVAAIPEGPSPVTKFLLEWGGSRAVNAALVEAARRCDIEAAKVLLRLGATTFAEAYEALASSPHNVYARPSAFAGLLRAKKRSFGRLDD